MKVLVAPNSFKEALDSIDVAKNIAIGLKRAADEFLITELPLADGGAGTMQIINRVLEGTIVKVKVSGPTDNKVEASYGLAKDFPSGDKIAIIELAQAAGLSLVPKRLRNPLKTTTNGVGQLILDASRKDCKKVLLGIGDSATIDCGVGALSVLRFKFLAKNEREITPDGYGLLNVNKIDISAVADELRRMKIIVLADVDNRLTGPDGALMFARQKGATDKMLSVIDDGLRRFRQVVLNQFGKDLDKITGSGAAGGIGGSIAVLLKGEIKSGFEVVSELTGLEDKIKDTDLVITGEGKIDKQSLYGKSLIKIIRLCNKYKKPIICLAGGINPEAKILYRYGVIGLYSIINEPMELEKAIVDTPMLLQNTAQAVGKTIRGYF